MADLAAMIEMVLAGRENVPASRSLLVGVSGIDASGKGYLTRRVVDRLREQQIKAVGIGADSWLNLPRRRFCRDNPAEHFYHHAIRFHEMFAQLVVPLRDQRSMVLEANLAEETATQYLRQTLCYDDVEVIVLEGIFLLKRAHRAHFDLSFWIECTFETALERALERGQEQMSSAETIRAYETIYFPAQRIHFQADQPREAASAVIANDSRLCQAPTG